MAKSLQFPSGCLMLYKDSLCAFLIAQITQKKLELLSNFQVRNYFPICHNAKYDCGNSCSKEIFL